MSNGQIPQVQGKAWQFLCVIGSLDRILLKFAFRSVESVVTTSEKESPARLRCVEKYSPEDIRSHLLYENHIRNPDIPRPEHTLYRTARSVCACTRKEGKVFARTIEEGMRKWGASCLLHPMCSSYTNVITTPPRNPDRPETQKHANPKTQCRVSSIPCVHVKRMSARPHPETRISPKPPKHRNRKTKCPVCGMPCVQVKRMPARPHPETPKTSNPQKS